MTDLTSPRALRRLIADSGHSFAVIEEAVASLRSRLGDVDPSDPDVVDILRAHLLAIGSPSDVAKYFSLELLERADPTRAASTYVEVVELLARSPIHPERAYPVERAMIRFLSEQKTIAALPALAVLAGREVYPLSRTAARAVAAIVGSTDQDDITDRLKRDDLPEASAPQTLSEGVSRALWPQERHSPRSSHERRRKLTQQNAAAPPPDASGASLRPETPKARQRRLRSIVSSAGRDPARCGNCDAVGPAKVGHVVPTARGGSDLPGNLVVLCGPCRKKLPSRRRDAFEDGRRRAAPIAEGGGQLDLFRAS